MTNSGIYLIYNTQNSKVYVGSSRNITRRWNQHRAELRSNRHHSYFLQRDWNTYGQAAFEFHVIELVRNPEMLLSREKVHLDTLQAWKDEYGYNSAKTVRV